MSENQEPESEQQEPEDPEVYKILVKIEFGSHIEAAKDNVRLAMELGHRLTLHETVVWNSIFHELDRSTDPETKQTIPYIRVCVDELETVSELIRLGEPLHTFSSGRPERPELDGPDWKKIGDGLERQNSDAGLEAFRSKLLLDLHDRVTVAEEKFGEAKKGGRSLSIDERVTWNALIDEFYDSTGNGYTETKLTSYYIDTCVKQIEKLAEDISHR